MLWESVLSSSNFAVCFFFFWELLKIFRERSRSKTVYFFCESRYRMLYSLFHIRHNRRSFQCIHIRIYNEKKKKPEKLNCVVLFGTLFLLFSTFSWSHSVYPSWRTWNLFSVYLLLFFWYIFFYISCCWILCAVLCVLIHNFLLFNWCGV